jgi:cell division protein FtsW (lipid II flippase)
MKTGTLMIRKIFDGTFWIAIAALIQPAMLLFFLVSFTSVFLFDRTKWRHWLVPFIAIICVAVISFTLEIFLNQEIFSKLLYRDAYVMSVMPEQWQASDWIAWILAAFALIGFVIYIVKLVDIQQRVRPRFSVLTISGICALFLLLVLNVQYVLLLVPVLAIFQVRALEHIRHKGFREFIFLTPALLLVVALLTR